MRSPQLIISIFSLGVSATCFAGNGLSTRDPITNIVDILPYVERCAKALDLEIPQPLTTNDVTEYKYTKFIREATVVVQNKWQFIFNASDRVIDDFQDFKHSMVVLRREEEIRPFMKPSKVTKEGALKLAWTYLNRLGYYERDLPLMPPKIKPWRWGEEPLPFFTIEWPWNKDPDITYLSVEIDGLRERVNYFYTLYPQKGRGPPPPYE